MFNKHSQVRGITLIEVLAATSILVIGLVAMLSSALALFKTTSFSGEFLTALNLAREGIEAVRSKRDENFLDGFTSVAAWKTGFKSSTAPTLAVMKPDVSTGTFRGKFAIEEVLYTMNDCVTTNKSCQVFFDSATGLYGDAGLLSVYGAEATKFYRMLEFTSVFCESLGTTIGNGLCVSGEEVGVKVVSRVSWYQARSLREATLEATLFKWQ